jgi:magnesium chelatase subunit D
VLAVDPAAIGGLWLRARAGPARDRALGLAASLWPALPRIHPAIQDGALYGEIDLAATLAAGAPVRRGGLLGRGGGLILTMAERCPAGLAGRLGTALDATDRAGLWLLALDEGAGPDEGLPSALADRLGLYADLDGLARADLAGEPALAAIGAARERVARVRLPDGAEAALVRAAAALGIGSLRAPGFAIAAARALAALDGRAEATADDIAEAAALTLAHRGSLPEQEDREADTPQPPDPPPDNGDQEGAAEGADRLPEEMLLEAVRAALPADTLARLQAGRAARAARGAAGQGAGAARKGNRRGRPLPSRPGRLDGTARIDLVATLRTAAPFQPMRRQATGRAGTLEIRQDDIRLRRYQETSDRLVIFAVDASGSAALARLAEAKGAVELLLAEAYVRRDHVALIAFRGAGAEVLLPPSRSLVQTKRRLAGLPGGGGTPLASGLDAALRLALQARARGMTPAIALMTDGRANVALDGNPGRAAAEADALRLAKALRAAGIDALVIDTGNRPEPSLSRLAAEMGAAYLPLPRADAGRMKNAVAAALGA